MTTALYTCPAFGEHEVPPGHAEHKGRYKAIADALSDPDFSALRRLTAPHGLLKAISLAHDDAYIAHIEQTAPATGLAQLDADTFMGPNSREATFRAVGAACEAVDRICAGEITNAFILARPPGHHAEPDRAMGFCLFNHAAVAALHAQASHQLARVAVVDFDVHHGNGTEAIFWDRETAFFASSHEWPQYPGTGRESDRGAFDNICNAPLETGSDGSAFRRAWGERLLPALDRFRPDFVVISAGFDAHRADPLGGLRLDEADFARVTEQIMSVAASCCNGRIVSILEGGYDLRALAQSATAHVRALMGA